MGFFKIFICKYLAIKIFICKRVSKGGVFAAPTSAAGSLRSPMKEGRPTESREGGWMSFKKEKYIKKSKKKDENKRIKNMKESRPTESREGGWMSFFQNSAFFSQNRFTFKASTYYWVYRLTRSTFSPCFYTIYKRKPQISGKSFIALQWILQDVVLERSPSYFETRRTTGSPELQ